MRTCKYCGCSLDPGEPCDCMTTNEHVDAIIAAAESEPYYWEEGKKI